jgi:DNA-directed RNA polymerase subunit RPC12/RpoP
MLPTHNVLCPACGQFLYTALSLEDVMAEDAPTSPPIASDARGDYLRCEHCHARVAMKRITTDKGVGYRIADPVSH